MRGKFGWDLPPGVSHHMIEEQAGAFEDEEMEGLMGEIIENLESICDPMASYHPSKGEYLRDLAQTLITLILSAVRDGRLDEELGVVARWPKLRAYDEVTRLFLASDAGDGSLPGSRHYMPPIAPGELIDIIALRPLTGTGKEETKNGDGSGRPD